MYNPLKPLSLIPTPINPQITIISMPIITATLII
jgi:hypothetical protein